MTSALDTMIEGCQIINPEFRYLYVNEALAAQGKRAKHELIGMSPTQRRHLLEIQRADREILGHLHELLTALDNIDDPELIARDNK